MTPRAFLAALREEIEAHPAVNHLLLNRLATAPFSREDYRVLAENHYPLVCAFTTYLEVLVLRAPDSSARLWLTKVLVDEYGERSEGEDHAEHYGYFMRACGGDPARVQGEAVRTPALRFIREHQRLVREEPFLVGLGAVGPGHEWAIPKMFDAIIAGLRRAGLSEDEIGYFTLHCEQDCDHGAWLEEALARSTTTPEAQARVRQGALASLEARARFWDGVQRAIVQYRQPRAIRPDGARPRSTPRELLLTAWDGLPAARRLERRVRALRALRRPDIPALLAEARRVGR
ncbi:MAG: iron-containing redox enzyme family protein [Alphaproteobacteria bacterium]|nr:iron-containing redox enzyme family protein [Alphaproteobacteria bacterium]